MMWYPLFIIHVNNIHAASQDMEKIHMSINQEMDRENVVYAYNGISLSLKKIFELADYGMSLQDMALSEITH